MRISPIHIQADQRGFTLLEIIITISISSVLAIIIVQVMANQTTRSFEPIQIVNKNMALKAVMENITADYRYLLRNDSNPLGSLISNWNTKTTNWNKVSIASSTTCIKFDAGNEASADCSATDDLLKVTLTVQDTNHRLTALFTR